MDLKDTPDEQRFGLRVSTIVWVGLPVEAFFALAVFPTHRLAFIALLGMIALHLITIWRRVTRREFLVEVSSDGLRVPSLGTIRWSTVCDAELRGGGLVVRTGHPGGPLHLDYGMCAEQASAAASVRLSRATQWSDAAARTRRCEFDRLGVAL
jgi:hypothetical protein